MSSTPARRPDPAMENQPPLSKKEHPPSCPALAGVFGPGGILARAFPGYEPRPGQEIMAAAVLATLEEGGIMAAEAETGIGKTLGYLIPAVLSGQKVVISTGTLNLQDQILGKEIPFLQEHLDPEATALCIKGRQNYLCLYRWKQQLASRQLSLAGRSAELEAITGWLAETATGDRAELSWLPDDSLLWQDICSVTSRCLGANCPEGASCFITRLRKKAARARLLIVNHHLFFSDLALRRYGFAEVLPRYESVVFDEAHQLEQIATRYFGNTLSHFQFVELGRDTEQAAGSLAAGRKSKTCQLARALVAGAERFMTIFPPERGRWPLADFAADYPAWHSEVEALAASLEAMRRQFGDLAAEGETWPALERRATELAAALSFLTGEPESSHIYWYERREKSLNLAASPLDIAEALQRHLYDEVRSVILTSATLTAGGGFQYLRGQLGLPSGIKTLSLASPFDYGDRTLLYIPAKGFPSPGEPAYPEAARQCILELLEHSRGRGLVLFTSIRAMHQAQEFLTGRLAYPLLVQGEAPKSTLLHEFRQHTHSVLLAVASFWEGVDVPGQSLSCLIIDKLPFEVPSDPVLKARLERISQEGGNPFLDLQVPRAILSLRQGIGRLMRAASDRGVLAILDIRLFTKRYGRLFLESLPPSPVARDLEEVRRFFDSEP